MIEARFENQDVGLWHREIRGAYGIPPRDYGERHPKNTLEKAIAKVKKAREESRARQLEFVEEIIESSNANSSQMEQMQ